MYQLNILSIIQTLSTTIAKTSTLKIQLDGQGRARREAARRRKSECKINLGPR